MGRAGYDCTGAAYGSHAHKATRGIYRSLAGPTPRANTPVQGYMYAQAQGGCATPRASMMGINGGVATVPNSSHNVAAAAAAAQTFNMQNGIIGYGYGQQQQQQQQLQPQQQAMGFAQQVPSQGVYIQGNGVRYATTVPQGYTYAQPYQAMQGVNQAGYCVAGGVGVSGVAYSYPTSQGYHHGTTRGPYY